MKNSSADCSYRNKNRVIEIDMVKAIGIILMIMGHQGWGMGFDHWIHAFHMPMFFMISGFLYHKKSMREVVMSRVRSLLIPYIFLATIHLFIGCCVAVIDGETIQTYVPIKLYHIFLYNNESLPICGALWFLTALFILDTLYSLVDQLTTGVLKFIIIILISGIGITLSACKVILPFSVNAALVGVGLYFVGEQCRILYDNISLKGCLGFGIAGVLFSSFTIFLNLSVNVRQAEYGNAFLFFMNAIIMTIGIFLIILSVYGKVNANNLFMKELIYIGRNSIVYLGFNQLVLIFLKNIQFENIVANTAYKCMALLVCLFVLHCVAYMLKKTKLRLFIGG